MRLVPELTWVAEGDPPAPLDPRLLPLLEAIADTGSLTAAVARRKLSYRAAWGLLRSYQQRLGEPLVVLERGRGASLARTGERLVAADADARRRLTRIFERLALDLRSPADAKRVSAPPLAIAASHDLALAALRDRLNAGRRLKLEVSFMGSLDALLQFAAGRVEVAGFHAPLSPRSPGSEAPFLRSLRARTDRLIPFVDREQGLIVPRGNPAQVRDLRDIADRRLRFVNRQRGSGTRLLIDGLLAGDRIGTARIVGYENEEFTHAAVAATVASRGADAGFGLRAAAARYGLGFVPQVRERYWLAVRAAALDSVAITDLFRTLQGPVFARQVRRLPGYHLITAGGVTTIDALRPARQTVR